MAEARPGSKPPLPVVDAESAPFWEGLRQHRLLLQQCGSCGSFVFSPRALCPTCGARDLRWQEAAGRGVIYSYTISRRPATPWFAALVPYAVALIDLDEGPRMMSNVLTDDLAELRIGRRVRVVFDDLDEDITAAKFVLEPEPAPDAG